MSRGWHFALGWLVLVSVSTCAQAQPAKQWGTLRGRFVVIGEAPQTANESVVLGPRGGLNNVVIFARGNKLPVAPGAAALPADVTATIQGGRFEPHVILLQVSQTLRLVNEDSIGYNPRVDLPRNPNWNPLLFAGTTEKLQVTHAEALPGRLADNIRPAPNGWVLVRDNPYAAVSNGDGQFEIAGLPTGILEFQLWHERVGPLAKFPVKEKATDTKGRLHLNILPGANDLGEIEVPGGRL